MKMTQQEDGCNAAFIEAYLSRQSLMDLMIAIIRHISCAKDVAQSIGSMDQPFQAYDLTFKIFANKAVFLTSVFSMQVHKVVILLMVSI